MLQVDQKNFDLDVEGGVLVANGAETRGGSVG